MIVVRPGVAVAECGRDFSLDTHRLIRAPGRHDAPSCAHREQRHRILVRDGSELDSVIAALAREPNSGVIAMPDSFTIAYRLEIISLADRYRLPAVYPYRFFAEVGGLLSYGVDLVDNYGRVATYVDRILKGENPSELGHIAGAHNAAPARPEAGHIAGPWGCLPLFQDAGRRRIGEPRKPPAFIAEAELAGGQRHQVVVRSSP